MTVISTTTLISTLQPSQIMSLTTQQVKALTTVQVSQLNTAQLGVLSNPQIAALTTTQITALSSTQVQSLSSSFIHGLSAPQVQALSTTQLHALTPANIDFLSNTQLQALTPIQVAALQPSASQTAAFLSKLNPSQLNQVVPLLGTAAVVCLSSSQVALLTVATIAALSTAQVSALTSTAVLNLSTAQVQALNIAQLNVLTTANIGILSSKQIQALSSIQILALQPTPSQIPALLSSLTALQLNQLSSQLGSAASGSYTSAQAAQLSTVALASLTTDQVQALSTAAFHALSSAQLKAFSTAQMNVLSQTNIGLLTSAQAQALSSAQISALQVSPSQELSFLTKLSTLQLNQSLPILGANAAAALTSSQVLQLTTSTVAALTTSQIQVLTTSAIQAFGTSQIQALTTTQFSLLNNSDLAALNYVQVQAITPKDLAVLSTQQLSNLSSSALTGITSKQISALSSSQIKYLNLTNPQLFSIPLPPSWLAGINDQVLKNDMTAADVNGVVSEAGMANLFTDLGAELVTSRLNLTSSQLTDLRLISSNLNVGETASAYISYLTNALINGNAANTTWTGGAAATTTLLSSSGSNLTPGLSVGTTANQINELNAKWFLGTDLPLSAVSMADNGKSSTFKISYSSASSNSIFSNTAPVYTDVNQGQLGDCYFESSLAEVAFQSPSVLQSMITNNNNGTYGVRFYYNGNAEYVTVNTQLPQISGQNVFNQTPSTQDTSLWVNLFEKAYAQVEAINNITGNTTAGTNSYTSIGNGGYSESALQAITGNTSVTDLASYNTASGRQWLEMSFTNGTTQGSNTLLSSTSLFTAISNSFNKGYDVTLNSQTSATDSQGKNTLIASHQFAVIGLNLSNQSVELYNPWGSRSSGQTWDTTFYVPVSTLLSAGDVFTTTAIAPTANEPWTQSSFQKIAPNVATKLTGLSVNDPCAGNSQITVQLSSSTATFGLTNGLVNGLQINNNNSKNITFVGNLTQINSALANVTDSSSIPAGYGNSFDLISMKVIDSGTGLQYIDSYADQVEVLKGASASASNILNSGLLAPTQSALVKPTSTDAGVFATSLSDQMSQALGNYLNSGTTEASSAPIPNDLTAQSPDVNNLSNPVMSPTLMASALNQAMLGVQSNSNSGAITTALVQTPVSSQLLNNSLASQPLLAKNSS